jgi:hypothetical protein
LDQKASIPLSATARSLLVLSAFVASLIAADAAAAARYVAIVSPPRGATVSGTVRWSATARPRPRRVEFRVDGRLLRIDRTAPYVYRWDSRRVRNGYHRLSVRAVWRVPSGTTSLTARRWVKVRNPTAPPPGTFPASFFTGPLAANNILPPREGVLVGLAATGSYTEIAQQLRSRESYLGRTLDIEHRFMNGTCTPDTLLIADIVARGHIPMITWSPMPSNADRILRGEADACIRAFGTALASSPHRIYLRLYHEFNGTWFPWSKNADGTLATHSQHRAMWQRTVDLLRSAGVSRAAMVWCPHEGYYGNGDAFDERIAYPGDAYVDWVCSDAYNHNQSNAWCGFHAGWCEFSETFTHGRVAPTYTPIGVEADFRGRKPFMVGETGSVEGTTGQKGQWFVNTRDYVKAYMSGLLAFVYFDVFDADKNRNWRLDTSASSLDGFRALARDPYFNTR